MPHLSSATQSDILSNGCNASILNLIIEVNEAQRILTNLLNMQIKHVWHTSAATLRFVHKHVGIHLNENFMRNYELQVKHHIKLLRLQWVCQLLEPRYSINKDVLYYNHNQHLQGCKKFPLHLSEWVKKVCIRSYQLLCSQFFHVFVRNDKIPRKQKKTGYMYFQLKWIPM